MAGEPLDSDRTSPLIDLSPTASIAHYQILRKIGSGGMGEVYLAEDTNLNRKVALKFLSHHLCQDADCRARFKREAQAAAKLDHPNIVTVYEVSDFQGRPFFAMQHIEGQSLRDFARDREVPISDIVSIGIQIADGLHAAHEHGVIHRDIKPGNIMIDAQGRVTILDFGLAAIAGADHLTKAGSTLGTIGYMSPEQVKGEPVDHRTDLFSMGVILYELISGTPPFRGANDAATLYNIVNAHLPPLSFHRRDVPIDLQNLVYELLAKDPEDRCRRADEVAEALRQFQPSRPSTSATARSRFSHQRVEWIRPRYAIPVALIAALGIILWQAIFRPGSVESRAPLHLAVIPFANLSNASDSQVFCDGLLETLSSKLTQLGDFEGALSVVPASEIRDKQITSAAQARRVFGVDFAVTGSVQQDESGIRATLNLVDASSERQLHSRIVDESRSGLTALQDTSIFELAAMLNLQLHPESRHALSAGNTNSSPAYDAYLRGQGHLQRYSSATGLDSAIRAFELSLGHDSLFALAYAGLGEANWRKYSLTKEPQLAEIGLRLSSRALELNDQLAPVLATLGVAHRESGQSQEAISYFRRALQIDSTDNETIKQLAATYESLGRIAEAESTYQRAIKLRPKSWRNHYSLARFYAFLGRSPDAFKSLATCEALAPPGTFPYELIGSLYTFLSDYRNAENLLRRSLEIEPQHYTYSNLGVIYQLQERFSDAAEMYRRALALNDKDFKVWINIAQVYAALPDAQEQSLNAYRHAIDLGEQNLGINPNDAETFGYLADCYWKTAQPERAVTLAERALALAPNDIEIIMRAGIVFEQAGRRDDAIKWVGAAAQRGFPLDRIKSTIELQRLLQDPRFDSMITNRR